MDFKATLASAFTTQVYMIIIPISVFVIMKLIGYIANRLISQQTLDRWFKPKEEVKKEKPKLNTGPFIEKGKETEGDPYLPNNMNPLIQIVKRESKDRGLNEKDWLVAYYTFQFGKYKDDRYLGHGALRVLNEEFIMPGQGYPQLKRKDFEIVTIILKGSLNHYDSLNNNLSLDVGSCQVMTCGEGISHLEENGSYGSSLHYLQLMFAPHFSNLTPDYEYLNFNFNLIKNRMVSLVSPYYKVDKIGVTHVQAEQKNKKNKEYKQEDKHVDEHKLNQTKLDGTLAINSDTFIYYCQLESGNKVICNIQNGTKRKAYVHLVSNTLGEDKDVLLSINYETRLKPGDGAFIGGLTNVEGIEFKNLGEDTAVFVVVDMA